MKTLLFILLSIHCFAQQYEEKNWKTLEMKYENGAKYLREQLLKQINKF